MDHAKQKCGGEFSLVSKCYQKKNKKVLWYLKNTTLACARENEL